MIKIYHNPRCSKSRLGLTFLKESSRDFEVIKYLDTSLIVEKLLDIVKKLNIEPIDLIRKNEKVWKDNYKDKTLSNTELINVMVENPKLIERPIIVNGNKAVIGRPTENINKII